MLAVYARANPPGIRQMQVSVHRCDGVLHCLLDERVPFIPFCAGFEIQTRCQCKPFDGCLHFGIFDTKHGETLPQTGRLFKAVYIVLLSLPLLFAKNCLCSRLREQREGKFTACHKDKEGDDHEHRRNTGQCRADRQKGIAAYNANGQGRPKELRHQIVHRDLPLQSFDCAFIIIRIPAVFDMA
jgi:hypothetical protein